MNLLSYDVEIYDDILEDNVNLANIRPSVAAICTCETDVKYFYDEPFMSVATARNLILEMMSYLDKGYAPFTWNGTAFDFPLLAFYTGMVEECAELALNGVDGMLLITFNKGYFLGLDAALMGANLETKTHHVFLKDGTELTDMSGKKAPELWRNGEFEAVKTYLRGDVIQPLKLADAILRNRGIRWTSKTGKAMMQVTGLNPVKTLFSLPVPDTSWMTNPKSRKDFVSWMPKDILVKNGVF